MNLCRVLNIYDCWTLLEFGEYPTIMRLAEALHLDLSDVVKMLNMVNLSPVIQKLFRRCINNSGYPRFTNRLPGSVTSQTAAIAPELKDPYLCNATITALVNRLMQNSTPFDIIPQRPI